MALRLASRGAAFNLPTVERVGHKKLVHLLPGDDRRNRAVPCSTLELIHLGFEITVARVADQRAMPKRSRSVLRPATDECKHPVLAKHGRHFRLVDLTRAPLLCDVVKVVNIEEHWAKVRCALPRVFTAWRVQCPRCANW